MGSSPFTLHGKAVVTRSVLRLVTGADADDERADAGYATSGDTAYGTATAPAVGPTPRAIPQRQRDGPAGHGEPGGAGSARAASAWLHAKFPRGGLACGDGIVVNGTRAGRVHRGEVFVHARVFCHRRCTPISAAFVSVYVRSTLCVRLQLRMWQRPSRCCVCSTSAGGVVCDAGWCVLLRRDARRTRAGRASGAS